MTHTRFVNKQIFMRHHPLGSWSLSSLRREPNSDVPCESYILGPPLPDCSGRTDQPGQQPPRLPRPRLDVSRIPVGRQRRPGVAGNVQQHDR